MECVETGECLWMVSNRHVFGFRIEKLLKLGKNELSNWRSTLLPPPSDFYLKLPERNSRPFLFRSKLCFIGGSIHSSADIHQLSYVGGSHGVIASEAVGIPRPPPTLLYEEGYVENIEGDVYLMAPHKMYEKGEREVGFWVLRSGSKMWYPLCLPPILLNPGFDVNTDMWECFLWKDKLLLEVDANPKGCPKKYIFHVYDPEADDDHPWRRLKRHFSYSEFHHRPRSIVPVSSLGDLGNCSVAMTWCLENYGMSPSKVEVKIHALLVDNQDYCIRWNQYLEEASQAIIPPYFVTILGINVNFVDLGEGKVCVLIGGVAAKDRVLCVLVLGLHLLQDHRQSPRFLNVDVLASQVYDMLPYKEKHQPSELPNRSFLLSLKQEREQKRARISRWDK